VPVLGGLHQNLIFGTDKSMKFELVISMPVNASDRLADEQASLADGTQRQGLTRCVATWRP
jgi:hypothetical protein